MCNYCMNVTVQLVYEISVLHGCSWLSTSLCLFERWCYGVLLSKVIEDTLRSPQKFWQMFYLKRQHNASKLCVLLGIRTYDRCTANCNGTVLQEWQHRHTLALGEFAEYLVSNVRRTKQNEVVVGNIVIMLVKAKGSRFLFTYCCL